MCNILVGVAGAYVGGKRILSYLRYLQQEEYQNDRFISWIHGRNAWDTKVRRISLWSLVAAIIASPFGGSVLGGVCLLSAAAFCMLGFREEDPRRTGKLKLKMTERAARIYRIALALFLASLMVWTGISMLFPNWLALIWQLIGVAVLVRLAPYYLTFGTAILAPGEDQIQQKYLEEAKVSYRRAKPFAIGITGSYGKTSTKAILGQLLELSVGPTFWPPKGINTIMGITRDIRERLVPGYRYAVVEMGAYGIGSIEKSTKAFPIDAALITAVGIMHLDRFGGAENVYRAKSELAKAVPPEGILICNGDNPGARRIATEFPSKTTLLYGLERSTGHLDCIAENIKTTKEGMEFSINWKGTSYGVRCPLVGKAAVSNVLGSFLMAVTLGADPQTLVAGISQLEPIENRLERKIFNGSIHLRDGYNSNPQGFLTALEQLRDEPGDRRILITPGMIELGDEQIAENQRVAKEAAAIVDLVFVVGSTNRTALVTGLREGGKSGDSILVFDTRDEAFAKLNEIQKPGDIVLIENDLPDLFEAEVRF